MRGLTIKREKSFVGCLMKVKVYVRDEELGDTKINGDKCYKLGDLKNGEEKTFAIGDEETKIYVIQDKLSKGICNEMCIIPAGIENVYLMGENKYNPFSGNAFRFHGMTDPRVLANRKKGTKRFAVYIAICVLVGLIGGFFAGYNSSDYAMDGDPVNIIDDSGVKMTLTDSFEETESNGYTFTYACEDVVVFGLQEDFSLMEGFEGYSPEEYGEMVISSSGVDAELQKENDLLFFEYQFYNEETDTNYSYLVAVYKSYDSFWSISFASAEVDYEFYRPMFLEWAESVMFIDNN